MKKRHEKLYAYTVVFEPLAEGGYQVSVPVLPGILTYGRTMREAKLMAQDAIRVHLEGLRKDAEVRPVEYRTPKQARVTVAV